MPPGSGHVSKPGVYIEDGKSVKLAKSLLKAVRSLKPPKIKNRPRPRPRRKQLYF